MEELVEMPRRSFSDMRRDTMERRRSLGENDMRNNEKASLLTRREDKGTKKLKIRG